MTTKEWMEIQFTRERNIRWIDGANPKHIGGYQSSFQVLSHRVPRAIWSYVNVRRPNGQRARYYLNGEAGETKGGFFIHLTMRWRTPRSFGHRAERTVFFAPQENAPKKLNKAIRELRRELDL